MGWHGCGPRAPPPPPLLTERRNHGPLQRPCLRRPRPALPLPHGWPVLGMPAPAATPVAAPTAPFHTPAVPLPVTAALAMARVPVPAPAAAPAHAPAWPAFGMPPADAPFAAVSFRWQQMSAGAATAEAALAAALLAAKSEASAAQERIRTIAFAWEHLQPVVPFTEHGALSSH
ncbi:calphotin-like [Panicum virgatum]|uniref:calphotin-like n=1 Tax=Panicum virgatum TaxID=38727 RepID=UPI0019D5FA50|nr:calphotin-like [Panicum virgatum]